MLLGTFPENFPENFPDSPRIEVLTKVFYPCTIPELYKYLLRESEIVMWWDEVHSNRYMI